jgi:murein DD-endopeptidase MepM/ murein hydrolase activator NlpD
MKEKNLRKRGLLLVLSAIAALGFGGGPDGFKLYIQGNGLRQGEAVLFELVPPEAAVWAEGRWLEQTVPFDVVNGRLLGMGAVERERRAGIYPLTVVVRFADGTSKTIIRRLPVRAVSFPRQQLTVDPRYVHLSKEDLARVAEDNALLNKVYAAGEKRRLWGGVFAKPAEGRWSSEYGVSRVFNGEERSYHKGLDIATGAGVEVHCCNSGKVVLARDLFFSGNTVIVDHGHNIFSGYMHLSEVWVKEGQEIHTGEIVGLTGATGRVTGPHLHWMLRVNGAACNPAGLLEMELD